MDKLLVTFFASSIVACGVQPAALVDQTAVSDCSASGGVCTSTVFVPSSASACGDRQPITRSCGAHSFSVCCPTSGALAATAASVNLEMPAAAVKFMDDNNMGDHHLGWHLSRRWDSISQDDQDWLVQQGFSRATYQEGEPQNGLEFLAMHRFVLQTLRTLPELASSVALFDGWTRVPDAADPMRAPSGPDSLAQNPPNPQAQDLTDELRSTISMCQDHPEQLAQFGSDDDLGRFLETTLGQQLAGAGLHNFLHNRFSNAQSSIDLGDPQKNFKNQLFWRLHGWIDRCWSTYRQINNKQDTDPDYVAALAKGAMEMHLPTPAN